MSNNETYQIIAPNAQIVTFDKNTNLVVGKKNNDSRYREKFSKTLLQAHHIMQSSPYKSYKPIYLDPSLKTGQSSTYVEFKKWQDLYLKAPVKGAIAPWTKKEKAYYQSLKTKRERYKYLVIRSGLRSAVIDIPYDAYCGVDDNGKLINKDYEYLYKEVTKNKNNLSLNDLFGGEWGIAAGILGNSWGFAQGAGLTSYGFKSRGIQSIFLAIQLGVKASFKQLQDAYEYWGLTAGVHTNPLRAMLIKEFAKNPPYDEFNMLPYLDELIGVDWVMDFNVYPYAEDAKGRTMRYLYNKIKEGILKDPRDSDSTKESREEFLEYAYGRLEYSSNYTQSPADDTEEEQANLFIDTMLLEAKIISITPPQGYPNAPHYYTPERLELIYRKHKLDKRLNPTIPATQRENFPEYLRAEIDSYAKKHNIQN